MRPEGFGQRFYPRHIHREEDESGDGGMGFNQITGANGTGDERQARRLIVLQGLIAKEPFFWPNLLKLF